MPPWLHGSSSEPSALPALHSLRFSCPLGSSSVLLECEMQQVANCGQAMLGGRVVSDRFLPGETKLLLPLSHCNISLKGKASL